MEAVDHTLQDILGNNQPFGGVVVLWGGDFRQILCVIEKGSWEDIVSACIQHSYLWPQKRVFHLTQNMQLGQSPEEQQFAQWLLSVGEEHNNPNIPNVQYPIELPLHMCIPGATEVESWRHFSIPYSQIYLILRQSPQAISLTAQSLPLKM